MFAGGCLPVARTSVWHLSLEGCLFYEGNCCMAPWVVWSKPLVSSYCKCPGLLVTRDPLTHFRARISLYERHISNDQVHSGQRLLVKSSALHRRLEPHMVLGARGQGQKAEPLTRNTKFLISQVEWRCRIRIRFNLTKKKSDISYNFKWWLKMYSYYRAIYFCFFERKSYLEAQNENRQKLKLFKLRYVTRPEILSPCFPRQC